MIISLTDQLKRTISLKAKPQRIISLVPSQTELLYDLGLEEEVMGITKFCVHPEKWFHTKARVGGTKKLDFEKIKALQPDLIIGNKEENEEVQIKELMQLYPVWMSDVKTLEDALHMIEWIGNFVSRREKALEISNSIKTDFHHLLSHSDQATKHRVAYLIWNDPIMTVGSDTFINHMLHYCGFINAFQNRKRYPEISISELQAAKPELILLSSEPYPFKEKHMQEFQFLCPDAKVLQVDGEMFSWYGSRLLKAPDYFRELIRHINNA